MDYREKDSNLKQYLWALYTWKTVTCIFNCNSPVLRDTCRKGDHIVRSCEVFSLSRLTPGFLNIIWKGCGNDWNSLNIPMWLTFHYHLCVVKQYTSRVADYTQDSHYVYFDLPWSHDWIAEWIDRLKVILTWGIVTEYLDLDKSSTHSMLTIVQKRGVLVNVVLREVLTKRWWKVKVAVCPFIVQ